VPDSVAADLLLEESDISLLGRLLIVVELAAVVEDAV
jgi:hypothetical protein